VEKSGNHPPFHLAKGLWGGDARSSRILQKRFSMANLQMSAVCMPADQVGVGKYLDFRLGQVGDHLTWPLVMMHH